MSSTTHESQHAIGVDIGGHGVKAVRVNAGGEILARERVSIDGVDERGIDAVEDAVASLVAALDGSGKLPVGVGIPGFHDHTTGRLRQSPNFPGWEEQLVGARLHDRLDRRVATENDANCALLGEAWTGAAQAARNVVMLTLGTGVGSAFLVGGTLLTGARGAGAEAGHLRLVPNGRLCGCGRRGCLESYVSGPSFMVTAAEEGAPAGTAPEEIILAALDGVPWASRALNRFSSDLADGLTQLVHVFAPAAIVLGGGLAESFEHFAGAVEAALRERAIPACLAGALPLRRAALGTDAGAVGAARLVSTGLKHG